MGISKIDPTLTIEKLQTMTESQFFDRKSARLSARDLAHHLSAFANASGGILALGIEDNGEITGLTSDQENAFRQAAFDYLQTPPEYQVEVVPCTLQRGENSHMMLFHIAPSSNEIVLFH